MLNRTLEHYLHCFTGDHPTRWMDWIAWAKYCYNTSVHSSTKLTLFEVVYGIKPPSLLSYTPGVTKVQAVDDTLKSRDEILKLLRQNLQLSQDRTKFHVDKNHNKQEFAVGDWGFLRLQPYHHSSVTLQKTLKLAPNFFGPYQVLARVGPVSYKLDLLIGSKIHNVFHVSNLKKKIGSLTTVAQQLPAL